MIMLGKKRRFIGWHNAFRLLTHTNGFQLFENFILGMIALFVLFVLGMTAYIMMAAMFV